jgi:hypothetical protein
MHTVDDRRLERNLGAFVESGSSFAPASHAIGGTGTAFYWLVRGATIRFDASIFAVAAE